MHIRPAADHEVELVAELRLAFLADHRGTDPATFDPAFVADTQAFVARHHRAGALLTWFALDGEVPVGLVSALLRAVPPRPEDPGTVEGYVINLYVPPAHRRRGIGQLLFDACLEHARRERYRRLVLHFTDDGRPIYERAGFVADERWLHLAL
jgi:GNAT superfamily N-acetyltransferase